VVVPVKKKQKKEEDEGGSRWEKREKMWLGPQGD